MVNKRQKEEERAVEVEDLKTFGICKSGCWQSVLLSAFLQSNLLTTKDICEKSATLSKNILYIFAPGFDATCLLL